MTEINIYTEFKETILKFAVHVKCLQKNTD